MCHAPLELVLYLEFVKPRRHRRHHGNPLHQPQRLEPRLKTLAFWVCMGPVLGGSTSPFWAKFRDAFTTCDEPRSRAVHGLARAVTSTVAQTIWLRQGIFAVAEGPRLLSSQYS